METKFVQVVGSQEEAKRIKRRPGGAQVMTQEEILREHKERKRDEEALARSGVPLFARIRASSKYYGQTKPGELFSVYIQPNTDYVFGGGPGGQYRRRDVDLFASVSQGKFVQITEEEK